MTEFGHCVKMWRGTSFIALNENNWLKFRSQVPEMKKENKVVDLTSKKRVIYKSFNDENFVSFEQKWVGRDKEDMITFINLNAAEWTTFVRCLHEIDEILVPGNLKVCIECLSTKEPHVMVDGKMKATELSPEEIMKIDAENYTVQNQMALRCTFCGQQHMLDCHCHKFDCDECSPDNFCANCGNIKFYPI